MVGLRLRAKNVDVDRRQLMIRNGKGAKDRGIVVPDGVVSAFKQQIESLRLLRTYGSLTEQWLHSLSFCWHEAVANQP